MDNYEYQNNKFKQNLEYLIEKKAITKKSLEVELGVGIGYLSRLTKEGSTQEPSVHLMKRLSDALGVTIDVLLYQDVRIEDEKIKGDNKIIKLIEKLMDETKALELKWYTFELEPYNWEGRSIDTDLYSYRSFEEDISIFISKYERNSRHMDMKKSKVWYAYLNNGTIVVFAKLQYENEEEFLELYLNNNQKAYPICCTGIEDSNIDIYLNNLYKCINYDVDECVANKLIEDYLQGIEEVYDREMPF